MTATARGRDTSRTPPRRGAGAAKPAARRPANAGQPRILPPGDPLPADDDDLDESGIPAILRFTTTDENDDTAAEEVRVPLFSVDGKVYTIPANPPPSIGLHASHLLGEEGVAPALANARATDYVLTTMLGEDGHAALRSLKKMTKKQLRQIVAIVTATAMGSVEDDPKDT